MRRRLYTAGFWIGAIGGLSYAVEASLLTLTGNMRDAAVAGGWALLGGTMAAAAILRRRVLPGTPAGDASIAAQE